jgi:hypothetical protein
MELWLHTLKNKGSLPFKVHSVCASPTAWSLFLSSSILKLGDQVNIEEASSTNCARIGSTYHLCNKFMAIKQADNSEHTGDKYLYNHWQVWISVPHIKVPQIS